MVTRRRRVRSGPTRRTEIAPFPARARIAVKRQRRILGVTTHKARALWYRDNATWPMIDTSATRVAEERARVRASLPPAQAAAAWELAGPSNIGGRMTAVVCDPTDANHLWVGAAGGGVWRSTDAGRTWTALWHTQESLNVGALAIDPKNPRILYCATGEANLSADSYPGVGVFKTTDGGDTWELVARAAIGGLPSRAGALAVDPADSNHVLLGGIDHDLPNLRLTGGLGGLYESTDAGRTWRRLEFVSSQNYRCHAIAFHPTQRGAIYVGVTEQGMRNGIWRTRDGGATWQHLRKGLPSPDRFDRTSLAIAPSKPSVVYALAAADDKVLGVFRSTDGGDSWTAIHRTAFHYQRKTRGGFPDDLERQMTYNNTIAVHPTNPDHVLCGGTDLHLTTNGGKTWQNVTFWDHDPGEPDYAHADQHALAMPATTPGRVYALNDGGVDVSEDGGRTWTNRSRGLAVTMFYDFDVAPSDSRALGGGAQDNGTPLCQTGRPDEFKDFTDGDGGWIDYHPTVANHLYVSSQRLRIVRHRPTDGWQDVSPDRRLFAPNELLPWMGYIAMDAKSPRTLFTGTNRVWRTRSDGDTWEPVSPFFKGVISAIEVAAADSRRIYVGTIAGTLHRSTDGGTTWSGNLASAVLPGFQITRIVTSPANADHVIVTIALFQCSHVFRSRDGGLSWVDVDRGRLPDVPHHSAAVPTNHPTEVYVANDVGVFVSPDFGDTWADMTRELPHVSVVDLVYHTATETLYAATYGRSAWKVRVR